MKNVYIMSGPPGSGKTHHAKAFAAVMASEGEAGALISADHFHCPTLMERLSPTYLGIAFNGLQSKSIKTALEDYQFSPEKLATAHPRCFKAFLQLLEGRINPFSIIVDNTNIHSFEIAPYYLAAQAMGAKVEILRVEAPLDVCIERGVHDVPDTVVIGMHKTHAEMQPHPWEEGLLPKQHMPWWVSRNV